MTANFVNSPRGAIAGTAAKARLANSEALSHALTAGVTVHAGHPTLPLADLLVA